MTREFVADGKDWVARRSGTGAYGTGIYGLGMIEAVHFAVKETPDVPVLEALLPAGALETLYDDDLLALFRSARKVVDPSQLPDRPVSRRGAGLS